MPRHRFPAATPLALALALAACQGSAPPTQPELAAGPGKALTAHGRGAPDGFVVSGVVRFLDIEGGCWQLQARNGARYELRPGQAPAAILVDGAKVVVRVQVRPDLVSICNVGQIVDVLRVISIPGP